MNTVKYFKFENNIGQQDPVSAYLLIIALEILLKSIKNNEHKISLIFLWNNENPVWKIIKSFNLLSKFCGLTSNISKCQVAGIDSLKGFKLTIYGVRCNNLTNDAIKMLTIHFSCNQKLQVEKKILKSINSMF